MSFKLPKQYQIAGLLSNGGDVRHAIDGVVSIWLAASIKHSNPLKNKNSFVLEVENKWGLSL